jgi:hypothetical protein
MKSTAVDKANDVIYFFNKCPKPLIRVAIGN